MDWLSKLFGKKKEEVKSGKDPYPLFEKDSYFLDTIDRSLQNPLTPEREEEMIDYVANGVKKYGMEAPAILFLGGIKPFSVIGSELGTVYAAPFLEFIGVKAYDWTTLFNKRDTIERIIQKIERNEEE